MALSWTKAEGHTYQEALDLILSWGYTARELDEFLAYNPGDLYRVPEAFGGPREVALGYAAPNAGGQAANPVTSGDPGVLTGTGAGSTSAAPISVLTNVAPPAVNVSPAAVSVGGGTTTIAGFQIPSWVWLAVAAGAIYYFAIRKR